MRANVLAATQDKTPLRIKVAKAFDLSTPGAAVAVAWSPDGSALAALSNYGGTFTIWSSAGHLINQFQKVGGGPNLGGAIAFFNGSSELLSPPPQNAPPNAILSIWDIATGRILRNVAGPNPGNAYAHDSADHFQTSPDQTLLVAGIRSDHNSVVMFHTSHWSALTTFGKTQGIFCLSMFGHKDFVAIGSIRGQVEVLDLRTGHEVIRLHAYALSPLAEFLIGATAGSPDGAFVLTGLGLGSIEGAYANSSGAAHWVQSQLPVNVFRVSDGMAVASLSGPAWPIRQAFWDPKGHYVAILDDEGFVYLWQPLCFSKPLKKFYVGRGLSLAVAPDGRHLAVATGDGVSVFEIKVN